MTSTSGNPVLRAAKRAVAATPFQAYVTLPTMAPGAARTIDLYDRLARRFTPTKDLGQLESAIPPGDMEHHGPCPLCGSDEVRIRYQPRFGTVIGTGRHSYLAGECSRCRLLRRVPAIKPDRVPDLYSGGTYSDFLDGDYGAGRQTVYRQVLDSFAPWFDRGDGRSVLDFGCGTGLFLEVARERGFEGYGVDLAPDAVEVARSRIGNDRIAPDPASLPRTAPDRFNLITMWSVLAHVADPRELMGELFERLAPGGRLLIYTVNAESLQRRAFGSHWNGFTPNHLIFWDATNLERLLREVGFRDVAFRLPIVHPGQFDSFRPGLVHRHHRTVRRWGGENMLTTAAEKTTKEFA